MALLEEFRQFALRGNVIDLAVGVIIGSAFGKIVTSLVEDIIMPPIGWLIGNVNFTELKFVLPSLVANQTQVSINYGNFLQILFNFMIIAFAIFLMIRFLNRAIPKKKESSTPPTETEILLEIRDLLKK